MSSGTGGTGREGPDEGNGGFRRATRARILNAVKDELAGRGYAGTSVTSIARAAGVTRPAFYELFTDKEACLLAAFDQAALAVTGEVTAALESSAPSEAHRSVLGVLARLAREQPSDFNLVTQHALVAGPRALAARDALLEQVCARLESRWSEARATDPIPDLPALLVIGAVIRHLGMAMRHGPVEWEQDIAALGAWIQGYAVPNRHRTWRDLAPVTGLAPPAAATVNRIQPPRPLPPRGTIPPAAYAAIERESIVHAAAEILSERGFDATGITAIAAAAGVPREAFYRHFDSRRAVVDAIATMLFEYAMAAMGGAYFVSGAPWAERIWQCTWALTSVLSSAPNFTHAAFIDAFAPNPVSARRADELFLGFTIFLTEASKETDAQRVSPIVPRAITGATIEIGATCIARGMIADLPGLVPLGTLLTIAPYVGVDAAKEFVKTRCEQAAGNVAR